MDLAACFYINLDERSERRRLVESRAHRLRGASLERWPAVRPTLADLETTHARVLARGVDEYVEQFREADGDERRYLGVIGCYLSHVGLMAHIVERFGDVDTPVLVLEDDVALGRRFLPRLCDRIARLPSDWDLVRVDCWGKRRADRISRGVYRLDSRWPKNHFGGTHLVLYRPSRIPKLLRLLEEFPVSDMDGVWRKHGLVGRLEHYAVYTGASRIALFPSDVRPGEESRWRRIQLRLRG